MGVEDSFDDTDLFNSGNTFDHEARESPDEGLMVIGSIRTEGRVEVFRIGDMVIKYDTLLREVVYEGIEYDVPGDPI